MTVSICSMFNADQICMDCKDEEEAHPDYEKARAAESAACLAKNYNFRGIGLPADLRR